MSEAVNTNNWEVVEKRIAGGGRGGKDWMSVPCVSVRKDGLTFNSSAVKAFGWKPQSLLFVLCRTGGQRSLGFKVASKEEDSSTAFTLRPNDRTAKSATLRISCKIGTRFSDALNRVYRMHLNPAERVVVAELQSDNIAKL
jgi:hypothetical protein